ncbi:MAG: tetratricopeptide repeat protein [Pseudomonadota bacterium]
MKRWIWILVLAAGCVPRPAPTPQEPTKTSLEGMAQGAENPTRAASMRIVEFGREELNQLRFERAANQFSKAIEIDASNPFAYFYLGLTRLQTKRLSQAADFFGRAADLFVTFPEWKSEALAYRGECLEKMNMLEAARKVYQRAIGVDSANNRAHMGLTRIGG